MLLFFSPLPYMFYFLFAPIVLLVIIGIFGIIRLTIKEYKTKKPDPKGAIRKDKQQDSEK